MLLQADNTTNNVAFIASHTNASALIPSNCDRGGNGRDYCGRGRNKGRGGGRSQHPQWTLPPYPHQ